MRVVTALIQNCSPGSDLVITDSKIQTETHSRAIRLTLGVLPSLVLCDLIHCKHEQEQLFYSFRLDDAVPEDHPMRRNSKVRSDGNVRNQRRILGIPAEG